LRCLSRTPFGRVEESYVQYKLKAKGKGPKRHPALPFPIWPSTFPKGLLWSRERCPKGREGIYELILNICWKVKSRKLKVKGARKLKVKSKATQLSADVGKSKV